MVVKNELLDLEKQFWQGDAVFYEQNLADDALMVFAEPVSVLDRVAAVRSIAGAPRWRNIRFDDVRLISPAEDSGVLVYKAVATREGDTSAYSAMATSLYVRRNGKWKLLLHQQTPNP